MLLGRVRRTLRERRLLAAGARVVVACSGGPDSAVLLDVLVKLRTELGLALVAASVDHQLRATSAADVRVAASLADRLGVPFRALAVDVPPAGSSLQARARTARYAALGALAAELGGAAIAVGHTRDDQAETVLARILRGAGPRGLTGIAPRRADGVIRPLIDCRREDVHAWAAREGLPFVRDPSNDDPRHLRVRVRHVLLPALTAEDASIVTHLATLADDLRDERGALSRRARRATERASTGGGLDAALLRRLDRSTLRELLRARLETIHVRATRAHLAALEALVRDGVGEVRLPGDRVARLAAGSLELVSVGPLPHRRRGPTLDGPDDDT